MPTSPGGSIFPYYYKNGELFGAHFSSFFDDSDRLIALMKAETEFFLRQNRAMPYWMDLYQTKLTDRVLAELIDMLERLRPRLVKLSLVGCSFLDKRRINHLIRQRESLVGLPLRFFMDPEEAKSWLVSESH